MKTLECRKLVAGSMLVWAAGLSLACGETSPPPAMLNDYVERDHLLRSPPTNASAAPSSPALPPDAGSNDAGSNDAVPAVHSAPAASDPGAQPSAPGQRPQGHNPARDAGADAGDAG